MGEKLKKDKASVKGRALEALRLRTSGSSYQQIADKLGYKDPSSAYKVIQRELKANIKESGDELVTLSLLELDQLQRSFQDTAERGDTRAAKIILEIMDRRAKLLGLNAPEKQEISMQSVELKFD